MRATVLTMPRTMWLRMVSAAVLFIAILALTMPPGRSQTDSGMAPVRDVAGHRVDLFGADTRAVVLFFVTDECPISNSYIPEMNRIVAQYGPEKVAFYAVYTDPSDSVAAIQEHAHAYGLQIPLIPDSDHALVRRAGATVTPEVALLTPGGRVAYRGRIDDWYVDFGERRAAPTHGYLREALDEVLSGKPVTTPRVAPIGCSIVP